MSEETKKTKNEQKINIEEKTKNILKCAKCGKEIPQRQIGGINYRLEEGGPYVCEECYNKKFPPLKQSQNPAIVEVKITSPIWTGFLIALGFFLFGLLIFFILTLFGASVINNLFR
jgi:hypothetical protein